MVHKGEKVLDHEVRSVSLDSWADLASVQNLKRKTSRAIKGLGKALTLAIMARRGTVQTYLGFWEFITEELNVL